MANSSYPVSMVSRAETQNFYRYRIKVHLMLDYKGLMHAGCTVVFIVPSQTYSSLGGPTVCDKDNAH